MEDFNSKYTGEQVEEMLDQIANGEIGGGGVTIETDPIFSASPAASITEAKKAEWDNKVDNVSGKGLSTEDFTSALKTKLEGLSNYDDTELSNALSTLRGDFDALVSGDTTTAIKTFNEVIAFLDSISDTEDLAGIIASIEQQLMWTKAEGEAGVRLKGTNGTATGNLAISAGDDKTASDGTQFTSVASGDHAVVFGYGNTCAGRTTLAQGLYNTVNGKDSVAFGQRNLVNGDQAFAAGQQNEVTTRLGVAIGYKNKATNTDSVAIGYQNTSSGSASISMGDTCEASGTSSTAMGYKTKATGAYSSTFGQNTQATNAGEVAMGLYNKSTTSTDTSEQTAFSFGIGTSDTNRVNAFEIKKNGDVYIGDELLSIGGITEETDPIFSASPAASITNEKMSMWDAKQDTITDLDTIREGASLGTTALQSVPAEYVTETELTNKGYATTSALNDKVDKISGKQLSTEDFTSALKTKLEGLSNYDDTEIENAITSLQTQFNTLVSGNASDAINSFNEIVAFLDGVKDTEDLSSIIASIEQQIAGKMDKVTLATVATSGSYNDLSNKPTIPSAVTESTVSGWGFTKNTGTYSKPSGGIPKSDLASAVQTSLGKADTALQSYTEQYKGTITGVSANGTSVATSGVANIPAASTSAYGVTKLSSATNSTSTTLAATASAVKAAYDLANSYKGTVTGVKVNGTTKSPSSGTVDIGNVVTSIKINGTTKTPSNGVVDLGTISGGSSSGGSSSGSTTTDTPIELDPNQSSFDVSTSGTYILKCNSGQNYVFMFDSSINCRIIMGLEVGSSYGAISFLHITGTVYWANNNEPIFEDGKMMELSFYALRTGFGYYSTLGTWASYDVTFTPNNSDYE